MEGIHDTLDMFFTRLDNTGSMSNSNLVKMVILSLIDDYKEDMIICNPSWKRKLDDIENSFLGTSCLFRNV